MSAGSDNFNVYWGDGTSSLGVSADIKHVYNTGGIYDIEITGDLAGFIFADSGDIDKLIDIRQWGNVAFEDWTSGFAGADNLTSITAIDEPNLSGVTSLESMFDASAFNGDISGWDTSNIVTMKRMFRDNTAFNQDISGWDTSSVESMREMFKNASAFDQDLGGWDVGAITEMDNMLNAAGLTVANYDAALIGWAAQVVQSGVNLGASGLVYSVAGQASRTSLISDDGWNISGDSLGVDPLIVTNTTDSGTGSLRGAINYANANASADEVTFNITGVGPHTISLTSTLPTLTDNGISIDGTTQSGSSCGNLWAGTAHNLNIRVDGVNNSFLIFDVSGADVTLKGLSVTRGSSAIRGQSGSANLTLQCNYIGLTPDGSAAGSTNFGLGLYNAGTLIGGLTAGQGNVISSNGRAILTYSGSSATAVRGNFIGTDPNGTLARANTASTINHWSGSATWSDITKNLISGNTANGIKFETDDTISGSSGDMVIAGNFIGVDRIGTTAIPNGGDGIKFESGSITNVTIGGTSASDRNVISGNGGNGIDIGGVSNISVLGNFVGLGADGSTLVRNTTHAINANSINTLAVGNGLSTGRNVLVGTSIGLNLTGTSTNVSINDNYLNTDSSGNIPTLSGLDGIVINGPVTTLDILNNVIGQVDQDKIEFWGSSTATGVTIQGNNIGVGADGTTDISGGVGLVGVRIWAGYTVTGLALGGNMIANSGDSGVYFDSSVTGVLTGNTIEANGSAGVEVINAGAAVAIYQNSIFGNTGLGIDLGTSDVTENDTNDVDAGPNALLNFPVIKSASGDGTTIFYDFDLDTMSNVDGYRIDFHLNSAADPTGHGEGETHLGFIDIAHAGGNLNFSGSFTGTQAIDEGAVISATTTRKTGASSYDVTSEFSLNYNSDAATELMATKSVDVFDPTSAGLYALPGNDIISSMTVTNVGNSAADTDTIVVIDAVPSEMTFYNGDMDEGGPATQPIYFTQTGGANLTFTYAADAAFSNSPSRPANMAGCTYTPSAGYDSNVTYVCFNPKGAMASGDPDPTFTVQFRARIK